MDWLIQYEATIRLSAFLGMLALMMGWEWLKPARRLQHPRWLRWSNNLGIVIINTLALRFLMPVVAISAALWAADNHYGWLNRAEYPAWAEILIAVVLLDLAIYLQHVLVHAVPMLWRFHRLHHADLDFDATTGLRFHPIEILFSMLIKVALVAVLGAPLVAVIIFEVILNAGSIFNHANVRLPTWLEPWVRAIIVTPDMHRVHHSKIREETNSNYGFSLSIWDRIFGTYRAQPRDGHQGMTIGLEYFRDPRELYLQNLLIQPFKNPEEPAQ